LGRTKIIESGYDSLVRATKQLSVDSGYQFPSQHFNNLIWTIKETVEKVE